MKNYFILVLLCGLSVILLPIVLITPNTTEKTTTQTDKTSQTQVIENDEKKAETIPQTTENSETITVFLSKEDKKIEISSFEYVCGSVAAEMPLAYEEEALKAQAVACYTNALRLKKSKDSKNSYISDDTAVHQGYINKKQRKEKWGEDFELYEQKLQNAVKEVFGKAIYYENELCVASFCAISNGKTENAENLWDFEIPYLKTADSSGDKLSPKYASTVTYTKDEFISLCKKAGVTVTNLNQIKIIDKSEIGTVLKVKINNKTYTGEKTREIFSLRSPTFTIKADKNTITFNVKGYGHGIGLSQNGANCLAQQGYTYDEILKHYYTGVKIK